MSLYDPFRALNFIWRYKLKGSIYSPPLSKLEIWLRGSYANHRFLTLLFPSIGGF